MNQGTKEPTAAKPISKSATSSGSMFDFMSSLLTPWKALCLAQRVSLIASALKQ